MKFRIRRGRALRKLMGPASGIFAEGSLLGWLPHALSRGRWLMALAAAAVGVALILLEVRRGD